MNIIKRIIAVILCFALLLPLFLNSVFAERGSESDEAIWENYWNEYWENHAEEWEELETPPLESKSGMRGNTTLSAMRARAEAIVNYQWTPSSNITTWNSNPYNGLKYFPSGATVTGMPYTLFTSEVVSQSLCSLAQYKAVASSNYSATAYCNSVSATRTGPVYGSCCADLVSEVFGGNFMSGNSPRYHSVGSIWNTSYGTTIHSQKMSDIRPGDAVSDYPNHYHIVWVGEVTDSTITIYEQTPPIARKLTLDKASHTNASGYFIYGNYTYSTITRSNEYSAVDDTPVQITPGVYTIHSARNWNKVIDIAGDSMESGANIQLFDFVDNDVQKFRVVKEGDYYCIQSIYSGMWLDVASPVTANRANVQLWYTNGNPEEKWSFEDAGNGYVYIKNYYGNYVDLASDSIDNNTNIQLYDTKESDSQRWRLIPVAEPVSVTPGIYSIHSARDTSKVLDIASDSLEDRANIQLYQFLDNTVQKFRIIQDGDYYMIQSVYSGYWLDVASPYTESHSNVQLFSVNSNPEEKWQFENAGDGYVYIRNYYGNYVDLASDSTEDRTNIQVYHAKENNSQRWRLLPDSYSIAINANGGTASTTSLDVRFGENCDLSSEFVSRNGYTLKGWNLYRPADHKWFASSAGWCTEAEISENGYSKVNYIPSLSMELDESWLNKADAVVIDTFTFYAVWEKDPSVTVTFDPNEGSVTQTSKTVTTGSEYGKLPTPTRENYSFDGWYTAITGGTKVTAATIVSATENHTLYARWTHVCAGGHNYVDTVTEPNCTTQGYTTHTCSVCGNTYSDTYTPALGHEYHYAVSVEPTTAAAGSLVGNCVRCDTTKTITLPILNPTDYTFEVTQPTCTGSGEERYIWKDTSFGNYTFVVVILATGHHSVSAVIEPTCTEPGYTVETCSVCHAELSKNKNAEPLGHDFRISSVAAPTLTETGSLCVACFRCDAVDTIQLPMLSEADYYYQILSYPACGSSGVGRYTWKNSEYGQAHFDCPIPAEEHNYTYSITLDPSETMPGELTGTCSYCGTEIVEPMPALSEVDYTFAVQKEPSCTEDGIETITWKETAFGVFSFTKAIEKIGHAYEGIVTSPTCTEQGYTTYTCIRCQDSYTQDYIEALGHTYENGACIRCGEADPAHTGTLPGDVDGDGDVTTADAVILARYLVDLIDLTEEQKLAADVTHDGDVTSADAIVLARYLVGLEDTLEPSRGIQRRNAASAAIIGAGTVSGRKGETVTVPVTISGNPGFAGFTFKVACPDALELINATAAPMLKDAESGSFTCNLEKRLINWTNAADVVDDGELFYLTFRILKDVDGPIEIGIQAKDGKESNFADEAGRSIVLNPFKDMPEKGNWAFDAINWAIGNKITSGTTATTFSMDDACTRAQVVTFLWRAAGEPEPTAKINPFKDIAEDAYYYKAVLWAFENGITLGMSETSFNPDATCSRAQVATFLWRMESKQASTITVNPFKDVAESAYYYDAVLWAVEKGITEGTSETTFDPTGFCTRAHCVAFLYREFAK